MNEKNTDQDIEETITDDSILNVPESRHDILAILKQDLNGYLQPLPEDILKALTKFSITLQSDCPNFHMITSEFPIVKQKIDDFILNKKRENQNIVNGIVEMLDEFDLKLKQSEEKSKTFQSLFKGLSDRNDKLFQDYKQVITDRVSDLKDQVFLMERIGSFHSSGNESSVFRQKNRVSESGNESSDSEDSSKDDDEEWD